MSKSAEYGDGRVPVGVSRRRFIGGAAGLSAIAAGPLALGQVLGAGDDPSNGTAMDAPTSTLATATTNRSSRAPVLVMIQLAGGNDHLNTLVPLENPKYKDLRGRGSIAPENTVRLDADHGLFAMPYLGSLWGSGELAVVRGVGYPGSTLSHFDDTDVWEKGTVRSGTTTGWLGRAIHAVAGGRPDPLAAMSLGRLSPALRAPGWNPVSLPEFGTVPWTVSDRRDWPRASRAFDLMTQRDRSDSSLSALAREGQRLVFDLADVVGPALERRDELEDADFDAEVMEPDQFFGGEQYVTPGVLGQQLGVVADLINSGVGARAYHLSQDGYDTHGDQAYQHPQLILSLDMAIEAFHRRLGRNRHRVVVATWSEFGRTPLWNGNGTDHGTAGTQFVVGSLVDGGFHGESPSLDSFDRDGNFVVTTDFRSYLGGLVAGVLGVEASDVFDPKVKPLEVIA